VCMNSGIPLAEYYHVLRRAVPQNAATVATATLPVHAGVAAAGVIVPRRASRDAIKGRSQVWPVWRAEGRGGKTARGPTTSSTPASHCSPTGGFRTRGQGSGGVTKMRDWDPTKTRHAGLDVPIRQFFLDQGRPKTKSPWSLFSHPPAVTAR